MKIEINPINMIQCIQELENRIQKLERANVKGMEFYTFKNSNWYYLRSDYPPDIDYSSIFVLQEIAARSPLHFSWAMHDMKRKNTTEHFMRRVCHLYACLLPYLNETWVISSKGMPIEASIGMILLESIVPDCFDTYEEILHMVKPHIDLDMAYIAPHNTTITIKKRLLLLLADARMMSSKQRARQLSIASKVLLDMVYSYDNIQQWIEEWDGEEKVSVDTTDERVIWRIICNMSADSLVLLDPQKLLGNFPVSHHILKRLSRRPCGQVKPILSALIPAHFTISKSVAVKYYAHNKAFLHILLEHIDKNN